MWGGLTGLGVALGNIAGRKIDQNKSGGVSLSSTLLALVVVGLLAFLTWRHPMPMVLVDTVVIILAIELCFH